MRSKRFAAGFPIEIRPGAAIALAGLLLLDPERLFFPFLLAAALHECAHLLCIRMLGIPVTFFSVGLSGAQLGIGETDPWREALCALAGPAVNLLTIPLVFRRSVRLAFVSLLLAAWNLLPVYPLDGGRILRCFWPKGADAVSLGFTILIVLSGASLTFYFRQGIWPILISLFFLCKFAANRRNEEKRIEKQTFTHYNMQRN